MSVLMASLDDPERQRDFAQSLGTSLVLLTATPEVARAYGVLAPEGRYTLRRTFFIDHDGVVRHIDREVDVTTHGREIADRLAELGFPRRKP